MLKQRYEMVQDILCRMELLETENALLTPIWLNARSDSPRARELGNRIDMNDTASAVLSGMLRDWGFELTQMVHDPCGRYYDVEQKLGSIDLGELDTEGKILCYAACDGVYDVTPTTIERVGEEE